MHAGLTIDNDNGMQGAHSFDLFCIASDELEHTLLAVPSPIGGRSGVVRTRMLYWRIVEVDNGGTVRQCVALQHPCCRGRIGNADSVVNVGDCRPGNVVARLLHDVKLRLKKHIGWVRDLVRDVHSHASG